MDAAAAWCTQVERPRDYNPEVAVLLGPTQPNPAVVAAIASSSLPRPAANGDASSSHAADSSFVAVGRTASLPAAHPGRASAPGSIPAGSGPAAAGAGGAGAACSKGGPRDLSLPADQSKQDEVFIGGLPSNWKAQQVGGGCALSA